MILASLEQARSLLGRILEKYPELNPRTNQERVPPTNEGGNREIGNLEKWNGTYGWLRIGKVNKEPGKEPRFVATVPPNRIFMHRVDVTQGVVPKLGNLFEFTKGKDTMDPPRTQAHDCKRVDISRVHNPDVAPGHGSTAQMGRDIDELQRKVERKQGEVDTLLKELQTLQGNTHTNKGREGGTGQRKKQGQGEGPTPPTPRYGHAATPGRTGQDSAPGEARAEEQMKVDPPQPEPQA
eukprot:gene3628-2569_t